MTTFPAPAPRPSLAAWCAVAVWTALILTLSGDSFSANETSRIIGPLLDFFFPGLDAATKALVHGLVRKAAHFFEYAVHGVLAFRALAPGRPPLRAGAFAVAIGLAVAIADEGGQALRSDRTGSRRDVVLDGAGAGFGVSISLAMAAARRRASRRA
jgi:VanZ family protein